MPRTGMGTKNFGLLYVSILNGSGLRKKKARIAKTHMEEKQLSLAVKYDNYINQIEIV